MLGLLHRTLGEFELTELIGVGGSGQVFRARQGPLNREAVVKVVRVGGQRRDEIADRFLREAKVASRLDHPFAAHVYAFGAEPDGVLWIAMEMVRGTPLDRVLAQGPLPVDRAVPFLRRLCEVVQTAHDQGIVHRDLKPSNVMVISRAGSVLPKLIDLGIAGDREHGDVVAGGRDPGAGPIGTPFYMAPEQWIEPAKAGPAADIYALGALTYEVLTGAPPFDGDSVLAVAVAHARRPPPRLPDRFPASLGDAIARAMAKRPADRFATALELGAALVDASGLAAEPVPLPQLDEAVRARVTLSAPPPIAESVALLESARNAHQAQLALARVAGAICQYAGIIALACRTRAGPGRRSDRTRVFELLRQLRQGGLAADGWWQLGRELCRAFAAIPDAHPVPELVALFFDRDGERTTPIEPLLASVDAGARSGGSADHARRSLAAALPGLADALDAVRFLDDYRLAFADQVWMGVRRSQRAAIALGEAATMGPVLVDADGLPVVALAPLIQVAPPIPDAAPELFLVDGDARDAARLVAVPHGFERRDDSLWEWLAASLGEIEPGRDQEDAERASPYRGLATFQETDADLFLGREQEVETFVNRMRAAPLIAVVGPSGVGKSSFARAGVLPALRRRGPIHALALRPGHAPLAGLAAQLSALGATVDAGAIATAPDLVGDHLRQLAADDDAQVVVLVDQFEELFTLCQDAAERAAYAACLAGAGRAVEDPVRVIVAVRDDFLVRASTLAPLRARLASSLHVLTTPSPHDLRRILAEPARRAGYEFEPGLLDDMIRDVIDGPGALALLSFTAAQLWDLRDRHFHRLPAKAYRALGGIGGALGRHAEDTLAAMSPEQQRLVRAAFRHLVTAEGTRAVIAHDDLVEVVGAAAGNRGVGVAVIDKLIESRLLVVSEGDRGEQRVEVAHEALLAAWPRAVTWRQEDADRVRFRDHLRSAARQWDERGRPAGLLWRGDALLEYRLWRPRFRDPLTAVEDAFARASERDASRTRRLRQAAVVALIAVMAVVSIVLWRLNQRAVAAAADAEQRMVASLIEQGRQSLLEGNTAASLLYLSDAYARGARGVALVYMLGRSRRAMAAVASEVAIDPPVAVSAIAIGPGPDDVVAAMDTELQAWNLERGAATARLELPAHVRWFALGGSIAAAGPAAANDTGALLWSAQDGSRRDLETSIEHTGGEITSDGRHLLLFNPFGANVYDTASGELVERLPSNAPVVGAEVSPDGARVAMMTGTKQLAIWQVSPPRGLATFALGEVAALGPFDAAGARVLTLDYTGDCAARLWSATDAKAAPIVMRGHLRAVLTGEVSPDGSRVATGSRDRTVKVWDAATGRLLLDLTGHRGLVEQVRFSQDGKRLLSLSTDRTARVWDAVTGAELVVIGLPDLRAAALAADGASVVTASAGKLQRWPAHHPDLALELAGHSAPAIAAAFSPDRRWIATEDRRQIVRLWSRATGELVKAFDEFDQRDDSAAMFGGNLRLQRKLLAFDPAGGRLAAPVGTAVAVWDIATGDRVALLEGHDNLVSSARFARDGSLLITAGQDGVARLWNVAAREPTGDLRGDGGPLWYAELSPDGTRAMTVGDSGMILWKIPGGERAHTFPGKEDGFQSGAFSGDGRRAAAAGTSGRIFIWSVDTGALEATLDTGSRNVRAVRFVGDELLVTTAGDGLTRVWDARRLVELSRFGLGGIGGEGGGIERWVEVSPDGGQFAVTGSDRTARVWTLELEPGDPAEVAAWVRCHLPLDLVDQRTVIRPRTPADCEPSR